MEQIKPFKPEFHLGQTVTTLDKRDDGRFTLETTAGTRFDAATVILAAGLGAFQPRHLRAMARPIGMAAPFTTASPTRNRSPARTS